jgi:rare lipoprotein A
VKTGSRLLIAVALVGLAVPALADEATGPTPTRVPDATHAPVPASGPAQMAQPPSEPVEPQASLPPDPAPPDAMLDEPPQALEEGDASWYGHRFHGRRTANGERFDQTALTAAHPWLPFGTRVRVQNLATGAEVEVRINDRGPFRAARIIDLSRAAARVLGFAVSGLARVRLWPVGESLVRLRVSP